MSYEDLFDIFDSIGYKVYSLDHGCAIDGPITLHVSAEGFGKMEREHATIVQHLKNAGYDCTKLNVKVQQDLYDEFTIESRSTHKIAGPMHVYLDADLIKVGEFGFMPVEESKPERGFELDGAL